ncbi:unnamed protein product [Cuscuta campestris]|uniref:Uncharacterized protein n=1 Tax=Cuscuta campestris TaxID=132261 RepID=A0A484KQL5_9ASTE|nr:unnamed protein product [Cuscuta campestris]
MWRLRGWPTTYGDYKYRIPSFLPSTWREIEGAGLQPCHLKALILSRIAHSISLINLYRKRRDMDSNCISEMMSS